MAVVASDLDPPEDPEGVDGIDVDFVIFVGRDEGEPVLVGVGAAAMGTIFGLSLENLTWEMEKLRYS